MSSKPLGLQPRKLRFLRFHFPLIYLLHKTKKIYKDLFLKYSMLKRVDKKGQFFIIAAVIIAIALVGLATVYNSVNSGVGSVKFYRYSEVLSQETPAVVDYSLYSGDDKIGEFINDAVFSVSNQNPEIDIFACFSSGQLDLLTCNNYGTNPIVVYTDTQNYYLEEGSETIVVDSSVSGSGSVSNYILPDPTIQNISISGMDEIIIESNSYNYTIDLGLASQSKQYYFLFRQNVSEGLYTSEVKLQ